MATLRTESFTTRDLGKIPAPEKGILYVYPKQRGAYLGLTITAKDARNFHAVVNTSGQTKRISLPNGSLAMMSVSEARNVAKKIIADALEGITPASKRKEQQKVLAAKKQSASTLSEVLESYIAQQKKRLDKPMKDSTAADYRKRIKHSFKEYLDRPLVEIDKSAVDDVIAERGKAGLSALRIIKALFNFVSAEGLEVTNPVPAKLPSYGRKQGYLKEQYFADFWSAVERLPDDAHHYFKFLLLTGVRADTEAGALQWEHIDWKAESFKLFNTKNQKDVELPLPSHIVPLLAARKQKSGPVFPGGEYREARDKIISAIGYHFSRHDLRRTFMTIGEGIDVSWLSLKRLSNHISGESGVSEGYVVVNLERLRRASLKVETEMLRLAGVSNVR